MNLLTIDQADLIGQLRRLVNPNYRKEFEVMLETYLSAKEKELERDIAMIAEGEARCDGEVYYYLHDPHADAMQDVPW